MFPRLYAIVDADVAAQHGWRVPDLARAYVAGGARLLQVRAKHAGSAAFLDMCEQVVSEARGQDALVVVNDRADIARLAGAAGVHVGQEDLPAEGAREIVGPEALVGLSTHSREQIDTAGELPVTYIAVGPMFPTLSKARPDPIVGIELVRYAATRQPRRPVVAIGGITLDRAAAIIEAGAASVAVISDLLSTGDPEARVREYRAALGAD